MTALPLVNSLAMDGDGGWRLLVDELLVVHLGYSRLEIGHGVVELTLELVHEAEGAYRPRLVAAAIVEEVLRGAQTHPAAIRWYPPQVYRMLRPTCGRSLPKLNTAQVSNASPDKENAT